MAIFRGMLLREGMRAGDLNDLVLPLLSVDEYESTIDSTAVAIGFYVHDEAAANDLMRFLQKSPVNILSSEVSPAPDQHGYFIVFIELMMSDNIGKNLESLLVEMEPLCEVGEWKMHVRKHDGMIPFTMENFTKALEHARAEDKKEKKKHDKQSKTLESMILDFLTPSSLENASMISDNSGKNLILETAQTHDCTFKIIDFGSLDDMAVKHDLAEMPIGIDLQQIIHSNRIAGMLGEGWSVTNVGKYLLVQHFSTDSCLLLT